MIIREFFIEREDGVKLYRTYSSAGMKILQNDTGIEYEEAIDIEDTPHTYSETNNPIDSDISDTEALNIIMGRDTVNEQE